MAETSVRRRRPERVTLTDLGRLGPQLQREVATLTARIIECTRRSAQLTTEARALTDEAERLLPERDRRAAILASLDGQAPAKAGGIPVAVGERAYVPAKEVRRLVLDFLGDPERAGRAMAVGYMAKKMKLDRTAVSRACTQLAREGAITLLRRGWYEGPARAAQAEEVTTQPPEDGGQRADDETGAEDPE
jgi:hypothetical protein